jgi:hypothetical protein
MLGVVPLLGLAELGLHLYFSRRAPDFDQYAALAPELLKLKKPGMPVVVSPSWAEPLVRQAAPAAFPLAELTRADDTRFAHFLEVSLLGARAPELGELPVREQRQLGAFTLLVRSNHRFEEARFDFVTAVENGEVEVYSDVSGRRSNCPSADVRRATTGGLHGPVARPQRRFECAQGRLVAVTIIEDERYRPRRCVLVDPPATGRTVLRFGSVPTSRRLLGFAGFSYFLGRDFTGEAAELRISDGDRELGGHGANPSRGWQRFELIRGPAQGAVEISVARATPEPTDFCFSLEAL